MGSIIEDELFSSSVIKDLHALDFDYVPAELPHRTEQLKKLAQMFKPLLTNIAQNAFIRGPVGTGKTAIDEAFLSVACSDRTETRNDDRIHPYQLSETVHGCDGSSWCSDAF